MLSWVLAGAGLVAAAAIFRLYDSFRSDVSALTSFSFPVRRPEPLVSFRVADPYAVPGEYRKAQLHLHTSNSPDVRDKRPIRETLLAYRRAGYSFAVVTDHDRVTDLGPVADLNAPDFVVVPGEEQTVPVVTWPLGRHFLRLGVGPGLAEVRGVAHPAWRGNLETGRWALQDLLARDDYQLFEVLNGKSNSELDFWLWHRVLAHRGPAAPVWAIAVDDTDNAHPMDCGWVMVKTAEVTAEALLSALRRGSFYATNGAVADFGAAEAPDGGGPVIRAEAADGVWIRFRDARGEVVAAFRGGQGEYRPAGDEGFVRVEVLNRTGYAAWSQPFFLIPAEGRREP